MTVRRVFTVLLLLAAASALGGVAFAQTTPSVDVDSTAAQSVGALVPADASAVDDAAAKYAPSPPPPLHRQPLPDAGLATDIADVKRDVVADLNRDADIMRPTIVPSDLKIQLGEIYAAGVLDAVTADTSKAMAAAAADPNYAVYDAHTFTVTQWQGVQVGTPVTAAVTVLGYDSWRTPGATTFQADPPLQWQLVLAKEGGRWKLVDEIAIDPAEVPAHDGDQYGVPRMP